jgi:hypothetical protein
MKTKDKTSTTRLRPLALRRLRAEQKRLALHHKSKKAHRKWLTRTEAAVFRHYRTRAVDCRAIDADDAWQLLIHDLFEHDDLGMKAFTERCVGYLEMLHGITLR